MMRVKIGSIWFEPDDATPVAVELTPDELATIAGMRADATRYAQFVDGRLNEIDVKEWAAQ